MRRYVLKKDLPTFKAGQLSYISEQENLIAGNPDKPEITDAGVQLMMYHKITLEKFPEILTEWFEEIEEPLDSTHWKPKIAEKYFYINEYGDVKWKIRDDDYVNNSLMAMGIVYPTEEACRKAKERRLAEVRLRRTSTFKPDFENGKGGWIVCYDHKGQLLFTIDPDYLSVGDVILYSSKKEAEKSIKENREDWLIYFGVKERED